ncbi:MAG: Ribose ABC transport system, ATP-binding protein RbsA [uncultured Rubellimicrobium sp.]|uniref:Ribose ABC transport system, ATP-binding protein RbsA n=1 Tax=uncultured Rubellimicrobium sp. TaxID=543078 RepID=A0A6J4PJJ7_9RHOB|nr:MAG: Ribose ABC transport system, ATP-binding protein RbsA [uncultured Rubellimicrobium sp.]
MSEQPSRLKLAGISKSFPGVRALDNVTFEVRPGEVHGLLGENGAGKSTLLNTLSAVFKADEGHIEIDGRPVEIRSPLEARAAGIAMIHQELQHVPHLTVAQNMFLGRPLRQAGGLLVDRRGQEERAREVLRDLDPAIDPATPIRELKVSQQQVVEIARALLENARVIAMDEPTSSLTPAEFDRLAVLIEQLAARGVSIIYVSHKMDEVFRVCDRATILRDGKFVDTVNMADMNEASIVARMVGREITHQTHTSHERSDALLEVSDLGRDKTVQGATFTLRRGEVLGISGLVGSGRTELLRLIAGIDRPTSGSIRVGGRPLRLHDPRAAIQAGIGLVPEDRKGHGIIRERSVAANMALPSMGRFSRFGLVSHGQRHRVAMKVMEDLRLRPLDVTRPIGKFSGGNQQKAIIGRWIAAGTDILLFDEPTRGIDVGAKSAIYALIERLAQEGKAIIVVSSEMLEIMRVSDRVMVMREGRLVATLERDQISEEAIAAHAIPQSQRSVHDASRPDRQDIIQ